MPGIVRIEEFEHGIRVQSEHWTIVHKAAAGGAWSSIVLSSNGRELLRAPAGSALRFVKAASNSPTEIFTSFSECNERAPRFRIETSAAGVTAVIAEGTYRDAAGTAIPVGYRRRTEYHAYGLIWTTLEIMSESGCDDVVEVRALELPLSPNWNEAFVRFHPTQAGGADLIGGRGRFDLKLKNATPFISRFTPLQISLRTSGAQGLDLFPGSDLAQWDTTFKPDMGLGCYRIANGMAGLDVEFSPYCMAFRRMKIKVQGAPALKLGMVLPSGLNRAKKAPADFTVISPPAPGDSAAAKDAARIVASAHTNGKKVLPAVSLNELNVSTPTFAQHGRAWMHQAAPSLDAIHNWHADGTSDALMCLKSGWFDHLKNQIDALLATQTWDGICLESATSHPCCHAQHGRGQYHSDVEQLIEFLIFARSRVGDEKLLALSLDGTPSLFAENIADVTL